MDFNVLVQEVSVGLRGVRRNKGHQRSPVDTLMLLLDGGGDAKPTFTPRGETNESKNSINIGTGSARSRMSFVRRGCTNDRITGFVLPSVERLS